MIRRDAERKPKHSCAVPQPVATLWLSRLLRLLSLLRLLLLPPLIGAEISARPGVNRGPPEGGGPQACALASVPSSALTGERQSGIGLKVFRARNRKVESGSGSRGCGFERRSTQPYDSTRRRA